MLSDPTLSHVYYDISWDEVAKYAVSSPEAISKTAAMLNRYPDRFLFGTDNVGPADQATQLRVYPPRQSTGLGSSEREVTRQLK